jgi:glycosyltransferase involved in cell wall biosynthesis
MRPRIVFSIFDDLSNPHYGGGGARVVREITQRLTDEFDVRVVSGAFPGARTQVIDGVQYEYIGIAVNFKSSRLSWLSATLSQFLFHFFVVFRCLRGDYDLWIETYTPPFSTSFIPLFTRKPVIGFVQMLSGEDMMRKYKLPFYLIERFGLRFYRHFIVLSSYFISKIKHYSPQADFAVIPNGVTLRDKSEVNNHYILSLGRIEVNQKGLDLLVDAYIQSGLRGTYQLRIAGNGTEADESVLRQLIAERGLGDDVVVHGRVEGEQKEQLFREATLIAITSRFETFNLVALEGFVYGKPVVYFALDTLQWIPYDVALVVPPFDTKAYGAALYELCTNAALYNEKSCRAYAVSQQFGWDSIATQYSAYIRQVLSAAM